MRLLIVNNVVPDPNGPGADLRLTLLIHSWLRSGNTVTLLAMRRSFNISIVDTWIGAGVEVYIDARAHINLDTGLLDDTLLPAILSNHIFDAAVVALWFWAPLSAPELYFDALRIISPNTFIVLLTDDSHGNRQEQVARLNPTLIECECAIDLKLREREAYKKSDAIIVLSASERENVLSLDPLSACFVVPLSLHPRRPIKPFEERNGLCFIGNFRNEATKRTLDLLLQQVLPLIRQRLGNISLAIGGFNTDRLTMHRTDSIVIEGEIKDLATFFGRHRLFVCPTVYGTGITTKVLLAMSYGIPTITSPHGLPDLLHLSYKELVVNTNIAQIVDNVVKIYTDPKLWHAVSDALLENVARQNLEMVDKSLEELLSLSSKDTNLRRSVDAQWSTITALREATKYGWTESKKQPLAVKLLAVSKSELRKGNSEGALKSLRHAISMSKSWLKSDPDAASVYMQMIKTLLKAYALQGNEEAQSRVLVEKHRYKCLLRLGEAERV